MRGRRRAFLFLKKELRIKRTIQHLFITNLGCKLGHPIKPRHPLALNRRIRPRRDINRPIGVVAGLSPVEPSTPEPRSRATPAPPSFRRGRCLPGHPGVGGGPWRGRRCGRGGSGHPGAIPARLGVPAAATTLAQVRTWLGERHTRGGGAPGSPLLGDWALLATQKRAAAASCARCVSLACGADAAHRRGDTSAARQGCSLQPTSEAQHLTWEPSTSLLAFASPPSQSCSRGGHCSPCSLHVTNAPWERRAEIAP